MDFPQTLTKKAIAKYRQLSRKGKLSRRDDRGVTLAYALWLANNRVGTLQAGMELIGHTRDKQPKARFVQMIYQDPAGNTWDRQGIRAAARWAKAVRPAAGPAIPKRRKVAQQAALPFDDASNAPSAIHWQEIHPANLQWFAARWDRDGMRTADAMSMMEVLMRFEGVTATKPNPRQLGFDYPDEGAPEPERAPLNSPWYVQLVPPKPRASRASGTPSAPSAHNGI
jgi:hypothetical protein